MGSSAEDGSLNLYSRGSLHSKVRFYCVLAGGEQKYNTTKFNRIQRMAYADATGTLEFCPADDAYMQC